MARTGTPTGRVALPLPELPPERVLELAGQIVGTEGGTFDLSRTDVEAQREQLALVLREEQKQMALSTFSSYGGGGFLTQPTMGGGGLAEVLINAGTNIATAIINRGNNQPAQMPAGSGMMTPVGGAQAGIERGVTMARDLGLLPAPAGTQISIAAQAPAGGWPTTQDGRPRRVRRDGRPWKRPSMQVTNPRALRRAMRRVEGFAGLAKRTIRFTKKVKPVGKKRR